MRPSDQAISYATVMENLLSRLKGIGLDPNQLGLHSLRSGGATTVANLAVNGRLFEIEMIQMRKSKFTKIENLYFFIFQIPWILILALTLKYTRLNCYKNCVLISLSGV